MKFHLFPLLLVIAFCSVARAVVSIEQAPTADEVSALLVSIGGLQGAGAGVIAYVVAQAVAFVLRTPLGQLLGIHRLLIISLISYVAGVLSLVFVGNLHFSAALVHSSVLPLASVWIDQIFKQKSKIEADKSIAVPAKAA